GCILDIGREDDKADSTRYNLIEDSRFFHGGHHVLGVYGKYNVIRRNSFHNEPWSMGTAESDRGAVLYGDRNLSFSGYSENGGRNLFEGNRVGYSSDPSDNNGASGMSLNSSENIVRFNTYFHNISAGVSMSVTKSYLQSIFGNRIYHNSFFNNGHNPYNPKDHSSSGISIAIYSGPLIVKDNVLKNNILYRHRIPFGEYNINTSDRKGLISAQILENNWNGDAQGDPKFAQADTVLSNPLDDGSPDLRLATDSPCKDAGTYLTIVTSLSGSGKSFQVADAEYFMDGWGIEHVRGDLIQLSGTSRRARIVKVDYATNTITVDAKISWRRNQGVSLAYEGTAPDIGAYEYGANDF
ncbi:MAG: right-handed parallel beta-helix repeat-containing protein, partial [Candidatus Latescibacterota bacterium]